ncbi:hypothetical protein HHX47_DHR1002070 [Lentinula edodes]|nr:hypothetical protein HHX47_DHR1002070 [Lentinula edodes]
MVVLPKIKQSLRRNTSLVCLLDSVRNPHQREKNPILLRAAFCIAPQSNPFHGLRQIRLGGIESHRRRKPTSSR